MFVSVSCCFVIPIRFWGKVFASSGFSDQVWFSAKRGGLRLVRHRSAQRTDSSAGETDSPWRTWGNAPGFVKPTKPPALEARFPFCATSMHDCPMPNHSQARHQFDERLSGELINLIALSALGHRGSNSWGDAPGSSLRRAFGAKDARDHRSRTTD